jgi:hypothetical protein
VSALATLVANSDVLQLAAFKVSHSQQRNDLKVQVSKHVESCLARLHISDGYLIEGHFNYRLHR